MVVLRFDGGLIVLRIRACPGEEDLAVSGPVVEVVVDELGPVVEVESGHQVGHRVHELCAGIDDVGRGVVLHRVGIDPPGVHVGVVHAAGELAVEGRAAVGDGIDFEEAGFVVEFVTGLGHGDGVTQ